MDARADAADTATPRVPRCEPHEVWCLDRQTEQLRFQIEPATGEIINAPLMGGAILSTVDARIGGRMPTESYIYARFTPTGLEKIVLTDDQAVTSTDWDIAFQRSIMRLNSGPSGPSCVESTEAPIGSNWDTFQRIPSDTVFRPESYFSKVLCNYASDFAQRPSTLLSTYYTLTRCVRMSHVLQLVQLRDGRKLKLEVLSYYDPETQMRCDAGEDIGQNVQSAGELRIRWMFLEP